MKYLIVLSFLISILACGNETSDQMSKAPRKVEDATTPVQTDCKYGAPVAIFSEKIDQIKKQSFELIGQKGIETVEFTDGNVLELYQSGCNEIHQEYRFFLKGNYADKEDAFWFDKAIERLTFVGQMDERYAVMGMWVGAVEAMREQMTIGQFSEAELNTFIMVDKLVEEESAIVILVLERRA